jgi:hypothetical protein
VLILAASGSGARPSISSSPFVLLSSLTVNPSDLTVFLE